MFFFNDTATTEIYTLSLHDALPISHSPNASRRPRVAAGASVRVRGASPVDVLVRTSSDVLMVAPYAGITRSGSSGRRRVESPSQPGPPELPHMARPTIGDRKSTRLNSSHANISYAVFCLKKKKHIPTSSFKSYKR